MLKLILPLALLVLSLTAKSDYPLSDHYDGERFFNPDHHEMKSLWDVLEWKLSTDPTPWPQHRPNKSYPFPSYDPQLRAMVTFINHATFLIQLDNLTVLTDPIFSPRAGPLSFVGPKRVRDPGVKLEDLPSLDVVVISHNHYDHLDLESLKSLDKKFRPLFLVPLGDKKLLKNSGITHVREMDWWEEHTIKGHTIIFTPAQHWSARGLFDKCKSLWGSYYLRSPEFRIYFAGDTGLGGHFKKIRQQLGRPDLSLLPIGAYEPRYFMKFSHMNPQDAKLAHQDLESQYSLGMHFGTFQLTDEGIDDPVNDFKALDIKNFEVLDHGESMLFN
jgi:L-ascorbate metabolism protein UlaG (beta-lactamase superfamily)